MSSPPNYVVQTEFVINRLFTKQEDALCTEQNEITQLNSVCLNETTGGFYIADGVYQSFKGYPLRNVDPQLYARAGLFHSNHSKTKKDRALATQTLLVLTCKTKYVEDFRQRLPPTVVELGGYAQYPEGSMAFTCDVFNPDNIKNGLAIIDYYAMLQFIL